MAMKTKLALIALLAGSAAPAGMLWAQTAPATPETAPAEDAAAEAAPAADAAAAEAPAADAPAADAEAPAADAPAAAADAPAADAAPATGTPAAPAQSAEEAPLGAFYVESEHGDWTLRCQRFGGEVDPCELYQLMRDGQGNPVAEMSIIPIEAGQAAAGATLVAPLETDLIAGVSLQVDSGQRETYPFSFCAPVGCVSRIGFTQAELDALRRGNTATVTVRPFGMEQQVDLRLSLTGFTAGWNELAARPDPVLPEAAAAPAQGEAPAEGEAPAAN